MAAEIPEPRCEACGGPAGDDGVCIQDCTPEVPEAAVQAAMEEIWRVLSESDPTTTQERRAMAERVLAAALPHLDAGEG